MFSLDFYVHNHGCPDRFLGKDEVFNLWLLYGIDLTADAAVTGGREAEAVGAVQCGQADPVES